MQNKLDDRFFNLLIGTRFARDKYLASDTQQSEEQDAPRRMLLQVEQDAHLKKGLQKEHDIAVRNAYLFELQSKVEDVVDGRLTETEEIFSDVLQHSDNIAAIFDILAVRAASVGRIYPLVSDLSWLCRDILHIVNLPQYRHEKYDDVKMDNVKLAMSYLGLNNLQQVIPAFSVYHSLPSTTYPFRLLRRKLWENALGVGLCAKALASSDGNDPYLAFVSGLYWNIGYIAAAKIYLRAFSNIRHSSLEEAKEADDHARHDVFFDAEPNGDHFAAFIKEHGPQISINTIEKMNLKRMPIMPVLEQLNRTKNPKDLDGIAKTVYQAQVYNRYEKLKKHQLIEKAEARNWLAKSGFNNEKLQSLKGIRLTRLNLKMDK